MTATAARAAEAQIRISARTGQAYPLANPQVYRDDDGGPDEYWMAEHVDMANVRTVYEVASADAKRPHNHYLVTKSRPNQYDRHPVWACGCPAYHFSAVEHGLLEASCKHILLVIEARSELADLEMSYAVAVAAAADYEALYGAAAA